jgi:phosphate starvation-inducible PhoH-like protein
VSHSAKRQAADRKSQKRQGKTPSVTITESTSTPEPVIIKARSPNQKRYMALLDSAADIVLADGPAGTGKTYLAVLWAIREYDAGRFDKIVITRPNVDAGDPLGFLPGTKEKKMEPWMMPIIDVFEEVYGAKNFQLMLERKEVVIEPLTFMRGRTFKNSIILGDEMQNTTVEQMVMFMTRIGENSKIICSGDLEQHDRGYAKSGLEFAIERFERHPSPRVAHLSFEASDVQRHDVIPHVLKAFAA